MAAVQETVLIDRSVEDVFEYMVKYDDHETEWQTNVIEAIITSQGPMDVGTTGREVRIFMGRRNESEWVVTEYDPPHKATFMSTSGAMPYTGSILLVDSEGGTKFTYRLEGKASGLWRLATLLTGWILAREFRADLATLKRILEEGPSE